MFSAALHQRTGSCFYQIEPIRSCAGAAVAQKGQKTGWVFLPVFLPSRMLRSRCAQCSGGCFFFLSPDCPGIQHPRSAVPGAGHIRRGDLRRLSVSAGSDAPHTVQRMLHGPGCPPGPRRHRCFRVRRKQRVINISAALQFVSERF